MFITRNCILIEIKYKLDLLTPLALLAVKDSEYLKFGPKLMLTVALL